MVNQLFVKNIECFIKNQTKSGVVRGWGGWGGQYSNKEEKPLLSRGIRGTQMRMDSIA